MSTKKKSAGPLSSPGTSILTDADNPSLSKSSPKKKKTIRTLPPPGKNAKSRVTLDASELLGVLIEIKNGNFNVRMPVDETGINGKICDTLNEIIEINRQMVFEFVKAGNTIGRQGNLTQRIEAAGARGSWNTAVASLNALISDLVHPIIEIARVISSVAKGDLAEQMPLEIGDHKLQGEFSKIANEVNGMVNQLELFSMEVTRVAREVGSEGKLGGQATVNGVGGVWKDLTDSVNMMATNLTEQVRNIAEVTTAVAKGDLSRKITVDAKGEILELKNTINTMVDQLNSFASEVTRVALEVGTEGKLGGQADVPGVAGTWKDLTDNVNKMAGNLTSQVRNIAEVTTAVANGDLSRKIDVDVKGEILELKNTINTMVEQLRGFASEVTRVAREVGTDGKLGGQANVPGAAGTWKDLTDSVNQMAGNLTAQVRNIAEVTKAVAGGDLSKTVAIDVKGEILDLKNTINTMVEQLNSFAYEVTRVAREVGTEGILGGQADVRGVAGTWKDLTDSVNMMASNLTSQVRGIAKVVTAVATGNLQQKLSINAKGEVAQLTETINEMIDTLAVFADQVTSVASEVGVEGKLGGQASVPGASGIWKTLTENVNQLAQNLTTQVRAISEVASAVTKGDLTRNIRVDAQGEVEALKDTINQMITNLRETTRINQEQDWLKSNLAKFNQMLQGQKDLNTVTSRILSELAQVVSAHHGAFYILKQDDYTKNIKLRLIAAYALDVSTNIPREFAIGEGLVGQCALEKERIILSNVPANYIRIRSGLGSTSPAHLIILPVLFENNVKAVIELASLEKFGETHLAFVSQLTESIGIVLNTIESNTRTEELLAQSQSLAGELKVQQEELKRTNDELQDKAMLLAKQKNQVEEKNREVEEARKSIEEKARQLSLTSKYKSEFLANMSHELRTPLNSLLILAQQLYENIEGNLTDKQTRYAKTIYSCGDDLIHLINDILDLSKIESGFISANISPVRFGEIASFVETTFKPISEAKRLQFSIETDPQLPELMETDPQRLNQILKNLLSNAFKFTEKGEVKLSIYEVVQRQNQGHPVLSHADRIVGFSISDTGIGILPEKQPIIFEAFQQAEGSTSRKYGGTGLGLSISRGLAELLGGTIELSSQPGKGSTFTLLLPLETNASIAMKEPAAYSIHGLPEQGKRPLHNNVHFENLMNLLNVTKEEIDDPAALHQNAVIPEIEDDRDHIQPGDKVILLMDTEPDTRKRITREAHLRDIKIIQPVNYVEVFDSILRFSPLAILLDNAYFNSGSRKLMDMLHDDLHYRHVPVYELSENEAPAPVPHIKGHYQKPLEENTVQALFGRISEGSDREVREVLIVDNNPLQASRLIKTLECNTIQVHHATGIEEPEWEHTAPFDCILLSYEALSAPGNNMPEKIGKIRKAGTPLIIYSTRRLSRQMIPGELEAAKLVMLNKDIETDQVLDEAVSQLYLNHNDLPEGKRKMLEGRWKKGDILIDKKVLVVDDDVRNLFALTSVFERFKINVFTAESGREAIRILGNNQEIDIVLMDIMMPEMDGYETIRQIRQHPEHRQLPIVAVTAKAMKGDREKCLEAGASDYITKPLKIDYLLSLMRIWLY